MNGRLEYKYLAPTALLDRLRAEIKPLTIVDPFAAAQDHNEYIVRSVYYDNQNRDCYCQKIAGIKVRKKFRIRGYNNGQEHSPVFIEIKRKFNNFISKNRGQVYFDQLNSLLQNRHTSVSGNINKFLFYYFANRLRPTTLVVYNREAYFGKFNSNLRLTFDKNLRASLFPEIKDLFNDEKLYPVIKNSFILEVKFYGSLPNWLRAIIIKYGLPRMALSKYANCLDLKNSIHTNIEPSKATGPKNRLYQSRPNEVISNVR